MTKYIKITASILGLLMLFWGCSKKQPDEKVNQTDTAQIEKAEALVQNEASVQKTEAPEAKAGEAPAPVIADNPYHLTPTKSSVWMQMPPEEAEKSILKAFATHGISGRLQIWREQAQMGDDLAKEAFVKEIFERAQTDPLYPEAMRYLMSIRKFNDPEILLKRVIVELQNVGKDEPMRDEVRNLVERLLEMNDENSLKFLVQYPGIGYQDAAIEKLREKYSAKVAAKDPEALYRWGEILDFSEAHKAEAAGFIQEATDAGYHEALYRLAESLMSSPGTWDQGFEKLQLAADRGSKDAWQMIANFYFLGIFADSAADAAMSFGMMVTEEEFASIQALIGRQPNPRKSYMDAVHHTEGNIDQCSPLLGLSISDSPTENELLARDYFIECLERVVKSNPSRNACDRIYDLATLADFDELKVEDYFSLQQRTAMGLSIIQCYETAFSKGKDFSEDSPFIGYSTAFQLASLFSGNDKLVISEDPDKAVSYVTYAAYHSDITGQFALGKLYEIGQYFPKNLYRACFWYQRIASSHICKEICAENETKSTCIACRDAADMLIECKKH